jgi:multicomponent Na+:H+ antiporter subunit D
VTAVLITLPVFLPLLGAAAALALGRWPVVQRVMGAGILTVVIADAVALLVRVDADGPVAVQAGGWEAPLGITLVADRLTALLLPVSAAIALAVLAYAVGQGVSERRPENVPSVFHPVYLTLVAGISLAFLSGDLFTLFVGFEVMLNSSYVLLTLGATRERVRSGMTYIAVSLTATILFLTAIGLVYAVTGTVNLGDLAVRMADVPAGLRTVLGLMLLVVFGLKAAVAPLHFWLPDSYPTAPAPVTAVFAALLTKVGVYALIRTQTLLFPREEAWTLLLAVAAATMLAGALGALVQDDLHRLLSFTLVAHVGFLLLGLALFSAAGIAGTLLYLVHHIAVQAGLFLVVGLIEREHGTASLRRLGGMAAMPALAALFAVPALSLGGVPPLAGFVGKVALLQAAVADGGAGAVTLAGVTLLASLLTLAAMGRVWTKVFWGERTPRTPGRDLTGEIVVATGAPATLMRAATVTVVAAGVAVAVAAGPLSQLAHRAATDLVTRVPYQEAVLGPDAPGVPVGTPLVAPGGAP